MPPPGRNDVCRNDAGETNSPPVSHSGAISGLGEVNMGIVCHSVWSSPHFAQRKTSRSPEVRAAHGTVSTLLSSIS
jgi:hypothetical protein